MIREIFKMLNQYAVDNPTLPVNQCFFPPPPIPEGMLSRFIGMPSRNEGPPSIWDTHGISGNVLADPKASSSEPYPQELNPWSRGAASFIHSGKSEKQKQDPRCQSGQSAKNSVLPSEGSFFQRIIGQTNNDCRSQIFISTNSPRQQHSLVGR